MSTSSNIASQIEVEARHATKTFQSLGGRTTKAVDDVSFVVKRNEFFTLIGPSGCGKSTILNMVGGLVTPTSGEVFVAGEPVTGINPNRIAYMFQQPALYPWRNVLKNVEFGLEIRNIPKKDRQERAEKILELVGLKGFETCYIHELSGGMVQRVSLARALVLETEILLMDEPFGALDEQTRTLLGEELLAVHGRMLERGRSLTIIFVTHSLSEAAFLSDRIAIITSRPGRIRDIVEVKTPRPRIAESEEVNKIRTVIWKQIADETRKALEKDFAK